MFQSGKYLQDQLPSNLFHVTSGDVVDHNGFRYRVKVNNDNTRTLEAMGQIDPVADLLKSVTDDYTRKLEDYTKKSKDFDANNPFVFDQVLGEERTKVAQRLDPYYQQTLGDFLTGVNIKRSRSLEDERTMLTELQQDVDQVSGEEKQRLVDALDRSREGFVDAGLYTSGARLREQGREETQTNKTLADTMTNQQRQEQRIKTQTSRIGEDLTLEERLKRRDLGREQSYQTESQALTETQRRQSQREFEKGQYAGTYPGVNPSTYQGGLYSILGA
jgi:hypothetical protein